MVTLAEEKEAFLRDDPDFFKKTESYFKVLDKKNAELVDWFLENMTFENLGPEDTLDSQTCKIPGIGRVLRKHRQTGRYRWNLSNDPFKISWSIHLAAKTKDQIELIEDLFEILGPATEFAVLMKSDDVLEYDHRALQVLLERCGKPGYYMIKGMFQRGDCMAELDTHVPHGSIDMPPIVLEEAVGRHPKDWKQIVEHYLRRTNRDMQDVLPFILVNMSKCPEDDHEAHDLIAQHWDDLLITAEERNFVTRMWIYHSNLRMLNWLVADRERATSLVKTVVEDPRRFSEKSARLAIEAARPVFQSDHADLRDWLNVRLLDESTCELELNELLDLSLDMYAREPIEWFKRVQECVGPANFRITLPHAMEMYGRPSALDAETYRWIAEKSLEPQTRDAIRLLGDDDWLIIDDRIVKIATLLVSIETNRRVLDGLHKSKTYRRLFWKYPEFGTVLLKRGVEPFPIDKDYYITVPLEMFQAYSEWLFTTNNMHVLKKMLQHMTPRCGDDMRRYAEQRAYVYERYSDLKRQFPYRFV